jgi:hypothetical protein
MREAVCPPSPSESPGSLGGFLGCHGSTEERYTTGKRHGSRHCKWKTPHRESAGLDQRRPTPQLASRGSNRVVQLPSISVMAPAGLN